ncbi:MAG: efflux RND transporter periplasmic adaptor subunit [Nitrospinae bacterium]|nr:efflux RND transporter periplasmic adaptor subunit [Nitrospinota bacterium]
MPPPLVTVTPVVKKRVIKTFELVGRTAAMKTVNLVARVTGYLEKRNFKEGEDIKKGDLLFVIEQAPYKIEVKSAEAKVAESNAILANAESYLQRLKSVRKGAVSQSDLDKSKSDLLKAQAGVMQAKASLEQAKLNLSYTEIRSPIDGRIGRVSIDEGNLVSSNTGTLATILKMDPIYVLFTVGEAAVLTEFQHQVKQGKARTFIPKIQLSNGTIYPFEGVEDFVSHEVDKKTGTITIRAIFPNQSKSIKPGKNELSGKRHILMPGQFVKVLVRRSDTSLQRVVPQIAIQEDQKGKFVLVVDADKRVNKRSIKVGDKQGIDWIIQQGVDVGELVITHGLQKVRPGLMVQIGPSSLKEKAQSK